MSSVWKVINKEWVALPASGTSGGEAIVWDALKCVFRGCLRVFHDNCKAGIRRRRVFLAHFSLWS